MAQTYLFSKQSRDEVYDHDTSYCFRCEELQEWFLKQKEYEKERANRQDT